MRGLDRQADGFNGKSNDVQGNFGLKMTRRFLKKSFWSLLNASRWPHDLYRRGLLSAYIGPGIVFIYWYTYFERL